MTEHESEELYEELRQKLADFGSQPSAGVWAGIQSQLQPPPPAPKPWYLRRRGTSLLLVGLVLVCVLIGLRQQKTTHVTASANPATTSGSRGETTETAPAASATRISDAGASSASESAKRRPATTSRELAARSAAPSPALISTTTARAAAALSEQSGPARKMSRPLASAVPTRRSTFVSGRSVAAARRRKRPVLVAVLDTRPGSATTANQPNDRAGRAASGVRFPSAPASSTATSTVTAPTTASALNPAEVPAAPHASVLANAAGPVAAPSLLTSGSTNELTPLNRIASVLQLPAAPGFSMLTTAVTLPEPEAKRTLPNRWSVQLLAGPTLSYRQLDTAGRASRPEAYERATTGYSAQVGVTYAAGPRLRVQAGLGYAEYATRLDVNLVTPQYTGNRFTGNREQRVQQRDTYRFVTVPLLLYYELGERGAFSYSVLGGSTVAFYTGGRTTRPDACLCEGQQTTWGTTNNPYKTASVGLTLGAALNYQLTPRWQLRLQPAANYSLTSLTRPDAGLATRRLWALGGQGGISYNLR
ncbi:outer membrane beta-barrel protein [Hymenobacter sp. BT175]|uniref:porin family protein n=1 Tax=Hymenobacter translucens TaxID=2886507 RepID=UPI001D0EE0E5|nr:porin family protein [Hymenobacter translucens]MCC2545386.1 outer membrane beta-barrel protein [Hymenobacter translucens]